MLGVSALICINVVETVCAPYRCERLAAAHDPGQRQRIQGGLIVTG
jgi:hypothetical protein